MDQRKLDRQAAAAQRRRVVSGVVFLLLILALSAAAAVGLSQSQDRAEAALERRFATRTALAATAAETYTDQLLDREASTAAASLSAGTGGFLPAVHAFGFTNAVLLDSTGRVLAVYPSNPDVLGVVIAPRYPHLAAAVAGRRAVSPVVPAAATAEPVVGFAVPFATASGRRVFSGAYRVRGTPLKEYVDSLVSLRGSRFFLIDQGGVVLAASGTGWLPRTLTAGDPDLAKAYRVQRGGSYGEAFLASQPVRGTPWVVVSTIPRSSLLAPIQGVGQLLTWGILAALLAAALVVWFLMIRRGQDHRDLEAAYQRLDRLARLDGLTGVHNRRSAGEQLAKAHREAVRDGTCLSVLMVDLDHFKRINDTFGHLAGDDALIAAAGRMQRGLRGDDVLGRWGGEEFLIVLPDTGPESALAVAERLRASVSTDAVSVGTGGDLVTVTVSVGVTSSAKAIPEVLVHTADRALYMAKADGRNRVHQLNPTAPHPMHR